MAEPSKALHKALLAALNTACSCSVYDGVPQDAAYPYVVMDDMQKGNEDFINARMDRRFYYLSIWSRTVGQEEVLGIIEEINAIHEQPLTLDTGEAFSVRIERGHTMREPDNRTFMGHVTLRILTTH